MEGSREQGLPEDLRAKLGELAAHCSSSVELQKVVARFRADHGQHAVGIDSWLRSVAERAITVRPAESKPAPQPEQIGPYRILDVLGEGGMGAVFVAEQTAPVKRRVALKLIKLGMDSKAVVASFTQ